MSDTKEKIPDPVGGSQEPLDDEEKLTKDGLESTDTLDDVAQLKKTEELEVSTAHLSRWTSKILTGHNRHLSTGPSCQR